MEKKTKNSPTPAEINTSIALFGRQDIRRLWELCSENSLDGNIARITLALEQIEQNGNGSQSKGAEEMKLLLEQRLAHLKKLEAEARQNEIQGK